MGNLAEHLKTLPLEELHRKAGARFGPFAGWHMPVTYPAGVMKEHLHTRQAAGLFDISHMKLIAIEGWEAAACLSFAVPVDAAALKPGQSRYTFLLNDAAGILDDLIVTRLDEYRFLIVANAGNAEADIAAFRQRARGFNCIVRPLERVLLAIQGPQAAAVLRDAGLPVDRLVFMQGCEPQAEWFLSRSGYTGEDGFELALPVDEAWPLAEKLLADSRVQWVGLAARDSLRLEAGLCLHGQDITAETNPVEAGLTFAVSKAVREKAGFVGAQTLQAAWSQPPARRRVGLKADTRQPVRAGAELVDDRGNRAGLVTSGGFGPSFNGPVAMGYVAAALAAPGTKLLTHIRGKQISVEVHSLPFIPQRYFKG